MKMRWPLYEIELTYDFLRGDAATQELQNILGFFESAQGQAQPFWLAPPGLSALTNQMIGTGDGATTVFPIAARDRGVHRAARGRVEPDGRARKRRCAGACRVEFSRPATSPA